MEFVEYESNELDDDEDYHDDSGDDWDRDDEDDGEDGGNNNNSGEGIQMSNEELEKEYQESYKTLKRNSLAVDNIFGDPDKWSGLFNPRNN